MIVPIVISLYLSLDLVGVFDTAEDQVQHLVHKVLLCRLPHHDTSTLEQEILKQEHITPQDYEYVYHCTVTVEDYLTSC